MSVSFHNAEALIDEVFLFGRSLRDVLAAHDEVGLPRALIGTLLVLSRVGTCRQSELAAEMAVSQGFLSRQVSELVEGGYVTRLSDPADGRASLISLSPQGRAIVDEVRTRRAKRLQEMLSGWTDEQATTALASLRSLKDLFCQSSHGGRVPPHPLSANTNNTTAVPVGTVPDQIGTSNS